MRLIKKLCNFTKIIAITAIFGFAFITCEEEAKDKTSGTNQGTDTITLSGTIKLPASPAAAEFYIQLYEPDEHDNWKRGIAVENFMVGTGETTSWSLEVPKSEFSKPTTVFFNLGVMDNNEEGLYEVGQVHKAYNVHNQNVSGITIDISHLTFVTLSGSINIIKGEYTPDLIKSAAVQIYDAATKAGIGTKVLKNINTNTEAHNFSMYVAAKENDTAVSFNIMYSINSEDLWDSDDYTGIYHIDKDIDGNEFSKYKNTNVSGYKVPFDLRLPFEKSFKELISPVRDSDSTATINISFQGDNDSICKIEIGGTPMVDGAWKTLVKYQYYGEAGKRYKYSFSAWTESGERAPLNIKYLHDDNKPNGGLYHWIEKIGDDQAEKIQSFVGEKLTSNGPHYLEFFLADQLGTLYISDFYIDEVPEDRPFKDRWYAYTEEGSAAEATIAFSGSNNSICEVTISGTAETGSPWRAQPMYSYTGTIGKQYKYEFKAWTASGEREITLIYFTDYADNNSSETITLNTDSTKVHSFTGEAMPKGRHSQLGFWSADLIGKYYISDIKITEVQ